MPSLAPFSTIYIYCIACFPETYISFRSTFIVVVVVVVTKPLALLPSSPGEKQVTVSGGAPAQTKTKSMYGSRSSMQPVWRTQLWIPVSIPCMSGSVKTIVKDWDSVGEDEVRMHALRSTYAGLVWCGVLQQWVEASWYDICTIPYCCCCFVHVNLY